MKPARLALVRELSDPRATIMTAAAAIQGVRSDSDLTRPPVIINPMAEADALMSWSIDQLAAVNQLLAAIADTPASSGMPPVASAVLHLTAQVETAVRAARQVHRDSFID